MAKKTRVLLVDDDKDDFEIIADFLASVETSTYSLEWVNQYDVAKKRIAENQHDVYLVDYRLGPRTGLELLREAIREGCKAPIILLTGYGDEDIDKTAMQEGGADYLLKGQITSHLLERSIRYAIYRFQTHAALKEGQQNIRSLFDSIFEGIVIINFSGEILLLNASAARIFGGDASRMLGASIKKYIVDDTLQNACSDSDVSQELQGMCENGSKISVEVTQKTYLFEGQQAKLLAIHDVTHKKELESQVIFQERLAAVGLLASGLAHEIGTPLGVIRGRAEFLAEQVSKNEIVTKNANIIVTQIDRVSHLIRSLLNLARGDTVKGLDVIDIHAAALDVVTLMSHEFSKAEIEFKDLISKNIEISTRGVVEPLHQVFLNLFVNSVQAIQTAKERGRANGHYIRLSAQQNDHFWTISVEDSGCGISKENMKNLFKPFFTTKEIGVGTGLGLVNSYRIINSWGGTISVESTEGVGTIFRLQLPNQSD